MNKKYMPAIIFISGVLFLVSAAYAKSDKGQQFRRVDRNSDGAIDKKEWRIEKQRENRNQERLEERTQDRLQDKKEEKAENKERSKVNNWWEKRADTNNDGTVDADELAAWKKLEKERMDLNNDGVIDAHEKGLSWRHARSKVNTELEKKYDANSDGWLEPAEVKQLLQDKATLIKTKGKAKVDNAIEAAYDSNGDGIIDASEAKNLNSDLK